MPEVIEVKTLIFDNLKYEVPSTVEEYNALDPKRVGAGRNPCLEDAIDDTIKHSVLSTFRSKFLDALEKKYEIKRINRGTEKAPKWETDGDMMDRVVATLAQQRGLDATKDETVNVIRDEMQTLAQETLTAVKFAVAGRERTGGGGGSPVGKGDIRMATEAVDTGKATQMATLLAKVLGREFTLGDDKETNVQTLARGLKDWRKKQSDDLEKQQREALGMGATTAAATA